LGHNARGIMPEGMALELHEAAGRGNADPFSVMIKWAENSISKAILGGTLTSSADGGTKTNALGRVHEDALWDITKSDAKQIQATLSRDLVMPDGEIRAVPEQYKTWQNPRTNKTQRVPLGVHPMFNHPPGGWYAHLKEYQKDQVASLPLALREAMQNADATAMRTAMGAEFDSTLRQAKYWLALKSVKEQQAWRALSDAELVAVRHYIGMGSKLNDELRGGPGGLYSAHAAVLESALGKLPNHEGRVRRGDRPADDVLQTYQEGAVVQHDFFTSSSYNDTLWFKGEPVHFVIYSKTGRRIGAVWPDGYAEVLFAPGTRFRVMDRFQMPDGKTQIILREI
jgi:hypothetical protein